MTFELIAYAQLGTISKRKNERELQQTHNASKHCHNQVYVAVTWLAVKSRVSYDQYK